MNNTTQKYLIKIQYNGARYKGWQFQPNSSTIQGVIEAKLKILLKQDIRIFVAGRTDAGVHANGQYAHFECHNELDEYKFLYNINALLKEETIAVIKLKKVHAEFHARFDCVSKTYIYYLWHSHTRNVFFENFAWQVPQFDLDKANECAAFLIGGHDFASFQDAQCQAKSSLRSVNFCQFTRSVLHENLIVMKIQGKSFLHHQVRIIVGTIHQIIAKNESAIKIKEILDKQNRQFAGPTAPAHGLFLENVLYHETINFKFL